MDKKIILIVVIAVLAIGGGAFFVMNKNSDDKNTTTSSQTDNSSSSSEKATTNTEEKTDTKTVSKAVDDACGVFTVSELMSKLSITPLAEGKPGTSSKTKDGLPLVQCEWEQGSGGPSDYTLHLDVYNFSSESNAKTDMDNSNVSGGSLTSEVVNGVADQALFARSGSSSKPNQALIYWRKGSTVYHLSAVRLDGVDRSDMENKLKTLVTSKF